MGADGQPLPVAQPVAAPVPTPLAVAIAMPITTPIAMPVAPPAPPAPPVPAVVPVASSFKRRAWILEAPAEKKRVWNFQHADEDSILLFLEAEPGMVRPTRAM